MRKKKEIGLRHFAFISFSLTLEFFKRFSHLLHLLR